MSNTPRIIANHLKILTELRESMDCHEWLRAYGYYVVSHPTNLFIWYALLVGPEDTTYTGAFLPLRITFPSDYPFRPPQIENMSKLSAKFNDNLWGADDQQSLMCADGQHRVFRGLVCMDILNTPHSKVIQDSSYGEPREVYDKSKEMYTPALNISSILMSIRSMIMTGETKLAYLDEPSLRYLVLTNLIIGVGCALLDIDDGQILYRPGEKEATSRWKGVVEDVVVRYHAKYQESASMLNERITDLDRERLAKIINHKESLPTP